MRKEITVLKTEQYILRVYADISNTKGFVGVNTYLIEIKDDQVVNQYDPIKIHKSQLSNYEKNNPFKFIKNYVCDFTHDDVEKVAKIVKKRLKDLQTAPSLYSNKVSSIEMYRELVEYIKNRNGIEDKDGNKVIFVEGGYGYIKTSHIEKVVKDLEHLGYSRKEMIDTINHLGALKHNKGRWALNKKISSGETAYHYAIDLTSPFNKILEVEKCA